MSCYKGRHGCCRDGISAPSSQPPIWIAKERKWSANCWLVKVSKFALLKGHSHVSRHHLFLPYNSCYLFWLWLLAFPGTSCKTLINLPTVAWGETTTPSPHMPQSNIAKLGTRNVQDVEKAVLTHPFMSDQCERSDLLWDTMPCSTLRMEAWSEVKPKGPWQGDIKLSLRLNMSLAYTFSLPTINTTITTDIINSRATLLCPTCPHTPLWTPHKLPQLNILRFLTRTNSSPIPSSWTRALKLVTTRVEPSLGKQLQPVTAGHFNHTISSVMGTGASAAGDLQQPILYVWKQPSTQ